MPKIVQRDSVTWIRPGLFARPPKVNGATAWPPLPSPHTLTAMPLSNQELELGLAVASPRSSNSNLTVAPVSSLWSLAPWGGGALTVLSSALGPSKSWPVRHSSPQLLSAGRHLSSGLSVSCTPERCQLCPADCTLHTFRSR